MRFEDSSLMDYKGVEFNVYKDDEGITFMKFLNGDWLDNIDAYANVFLGKCVSCTGFYKDSFKDFEYDSVLIAGLGFGLIPNELSVVNKCSKIDVVEISQEVIDYNTTSGHLPEDINIIKGDIMSYSTTEKYDLIIVDTVWRDEDMSEDKFQTLVSNFYNTNLNEGGALYVPVSNKWLINNN
jgi:hypothetical protein